jgi:hypothetical protein
LVAVTVSVVGNRILSFGILSGLIFVSFLLLLGFLIAGANVLSNTSHKSSSGVICAGRIVSPTGDSEEVRFEDTAFVRFGETVTDL